MKKNLLFVAVFITAIFASSANAQTVATFDDLSLPVDSFWNGSDMSGGFNNGNAHFSNTYNSQYSSWGGFAYSSKMDSLTAGFTNMYSSANGKGYSGSATYAVGFVSAYSGPTSISLTGSAKGKIVDGFYINNNTYTYQSMLNGDTYAKKFTSHDTDWFMLRTYGYMNGVMTDSVDFYLADFRFADSSKAYIVKSWTWIDLSTMGNVDSLSFAMSSSDNGAYGMNTPAYFCMDNFSTRDGVGFAENKLENNVRLYPNPVHSSINLDLGTITANQLLIYDANGRLVYENAHISSQLQIEVSHLNKGLYYFQIITDNGVISKKFIKK
jgi:hypothetical protein